MSDNLKGSFKSLCKNHFENASLGKSDLQKLIELQNNYKKLKGESIWTKPWLRVAGMGAAMVLVVLGVFSMNTYYNADLTDKIASDIVNKHHQNAFQTASYDIETDDIEEARTKLSQHGIKLTPSSHTRNLKLRGGKIVNLAGRKAAQLKYINAQNGKSYTVFQAKIPEPLRKTGFQRVVKEINGVKVIMWKERGVLHGMAEDEVKAIPASNTYK